MIQQKFTPNRLNLDTDQAYLTAMDYIKSLNLLPSLQGIGKGNVRESVKGNVQQLFSYGEAGSDVLKCVGEYALREEGKIIFLVYHSGNNHRLMQYDLATDSFTELVKSEYLALTENGLVTDLDVIENFCTWTNNGLVYLIDLDKARSSSVYIDVAEADKSIMFMNRPAPKQQLIVATGTDSTLPYNKMAQSNYQLAYLYVYINDHRSELSPYSDMPVFNRQNWGDDLGLPSEQPDGFMPNKLSVTVNLTTSQLKWVKGVEVFARNGNDAIWQRIKTIGEADLATSNTFDFNAHQAFQSVDTEESSRLFNPVPTEIKSTVLHENRMFAVANKTDYDVDETQFNLQFIERQITSFDNQARVCKSEGVYFAGIQFYDENMRSSRAYHVQKVVAPKLAPNYASDYWGMANSPRYRFEPIVSGTAPSWAKYYAIVRSKEQGTILYGQCPVNTFFYVRPVDASLSEDSHNYKIGEKLYSKKPTGSYTMDDTQNTAKFLHLQIPSNFPFVPDTDCYVRLLRDHGQTTDIQKVLQVEGDMLVVKNFGIDDWSSVSLHTTPLFVEIYKPNEEPSDSVLYEWSRMYDVQSGQGFLGSHTPLDMDTSNLFEFPYTFNRITGFTAMDTANAELPAFSEFAFGSESPTTHLKDVLDVIPLGEDNTRPWKQGYVPDYSKVAEALGRITAPATEDDGELERPTSLMYTGEYIQNSKINKLFRFSTADSYNIPTEYSPIRKLATVGRNLLVIHERETTTLFIGKAYMKTNEAEQFLLQSTNVIGDRHKHARSYGTINPESVLVSGEKAFFFDAYNGELCRFSQNGITPLGATFDCQSFFENAGKQVLANLSTARVIMGYDSKAEILYVSFSPELNIPTIAFCDREGERRFLGEFSFVPERYCNIDNRLYSWKSGQLYEHGIGSINTFYGIKYDSKITFVLNLEPSHTKTLNTISQLSNYPLAVSEVRTNRGHSSYLNTSSFKRLQDTWNANFRRDVNTAAAKLKAGRTAYLSGDYLQSEMAEIEMEYTGTNLLRLQEVNVKASILEGQLNN